MAHCAPAAALWRLRRRLRQQLLNQPLHRQGDGGELVKPLEGYAKGVK
jgi:hypothetical protein